MTEMSWCGSGVAGVVEGDHGWQQEKVLAEATAA